MAKMTEDEYRAFITHGTRTAKIATMRADGRPHVTPIWFVLDGETIIFTTGDTSLKAAAIRRDPRVCLCIDDDTPPFSFVMIEGTATIHPDDPDLVRWATAIGGRYMGADQAEAFGKRNGVPGESLVRVTPTKIVAEKDIAGW
jgi:PPOX class probable F420-dependent enzyme